VSRIFRSPAQSKAAQAIELRVGRTWVGSDSRILLIIDRIDRQSIFGSWSDCRGELGGIAWRTTGDRHCQKQCSRDEDTMVNSHEKMTPEKDSVNRGRMHRVLRNRGFRTAQDLQFW
jgi:hypothetical protein